MQPHSHSEEEESHRHSLGSGRRPLQRVGEPHPSVPPTDGQPRMGRSQGGDRVLVLLLSKIFLSRAGPLLQELLHMGALVLCEERTCVVRRAAEEAVLDQPILRKADGREGSLSLHPFFLLFLSIVLCTILIFSFLPTPRVKRSRPRRLTALYPCTFSSPTSVWSTTWSSPR